MSKNIVLCSDGTGQAGGQGFVSNVWRVFKAVDRHCPGQEQVAFHADGVGTEKNRALRAIGGAFGYGLSHDICSLYAMLVRSYSDSDNIYLFGFSRGAFTVRSLAGMIHHVGILKSDAFNSDQELTDEVHRAYIAYRKDEAYDNPNIHPSRKITFVGVWDTVDAIGVPVDELRDLIYFIAKYRFSPHKAELNPSIENAYHAISIDDERHTFYPLIWKEEGYTGNVEQVWFAGVHSNVGGGYPKDSLSYISLDWMMMRAHECGLKFCGSKWRDQSSPNIYGEYQEHANQNGRIYDSRAGLAVYYRYKPRKIQTLWKSANPDSNAKVHESALMRVMLGYTSYAPTAMPMKFDSVCTWSHDIDQVNFELDLDKAWDCIKQRVWLYYAFAITSILFVVAVLEYGIPTTIGGLFSVFAENPASFSGFVPVFVVLYWLRSNLKAETKKYADEAWSKLKKQWSLVKSGTKKGRPQKVVGLADYGAQK